MKYEDLRINEDMPEQEAIRREKLLKLEELGVNPFGQRYEVKDFSLDLKEKYADKTHEDLEECEVLTSIAGRIMAIRDMGKVAFILIQDKKGSIQAYLRKDALEEKEWQVYKLADIGDIVGIEGRLMKTRTNELTIKVSKYTHLVKSLRPLPEKFHGLADIEERSRRRYVDLMVNEDSRRIAFLRPKVIRAMQHYLDNLGYTEVETPVLGTILGGASARPFVTHHNTLDIDMYLRIATELPLKRLLVGGMDAVYEFGRLFRNEGMDKNHNPEFTTVEIYKAFSDLEGMMDLTEGLFGAAVLAAKGSYEVECRGHKVSLEPKFKRIHMVDAIREKTGINFFDKMSLEEAKKLAKEHDIEIEPHFQYGHIVNAFFEKYVEETIIEPTFVFGHPIEISPLTRKDPNDERFTQRFELFICGSEYCNAYTELNDPLDQVERFENQLKERELGNDEANDMDKDFIEALEYGMPPAGGVGIGIDRLVMLVAEVSTIREVILFPTMKPRQ